MKEEMCTISVDVPGDVKKEAMILFENLGLDVNTAINIFLRKSIIEWNIPFEIDDSPSRELLDAFEEFDYIEKHPNEYKIYSNTKELFNDLFI